MLRVELPILPTRPVLTHKDLDKRIKRVKDVWTPTHTTILLMHSEGKSVREIARETGLKHLTIKELIASIPLQQNLQTVKDNIVQTVMTQRLELMNHSSLHEAREMLQSACVQAVANIIIMANDPQCRSRVQLEACKDILDRAGLKPLIITETRERVYSPEEVVSAKKVLDEAQDIVKRLSNNTSPYVLGDSRVDKLVSSDTDKAPDVSTNSLGQ